MSALHVKPEPWGAYGFQIDGFAEAARLLVAVDSARPRLRLVREVAAAGEAAPRRPAGTVDLDDRSATIWITDTDTAALDRDTLTLRFVTQAPLGDDIVLHPYLALPASIASHWLGRQVFHGGAFLHDGRAWGLLGEKEAGKSSTLAALARAGIAVVSDDVMVVEDGTVFAAPRCIDLREEAAGVFGGADLGRLGSRGRWRLPAGDVPEAVPLAGFVHLEWAERTTIEPLGAEDALSRMLAQKVVYQGTPDSLRYLDLAALPAWRFARPRNLDRIDDANAQLLDALR